jgi:hypothetical protein
MREPTKPPMEEPMIMIEEATTRFVCPMIILVIQPRIRVRDPELKDVKNNNPYSNPEWSGVVGIATIHA